MIKSLFFILAIFFVNSVFSQEKEVTLTVEITGLKNNKGSILLQLSDELGKTVDKRKGKVINKACIFYFYKITCGKYAVRIFHDENGNNLLDTNWLGIPSEDYGFSNNAKATFGIPPLKDRLFELNGDKRIKIKMN